MTDRPLSDPAPRFPSLRTIVFWAHLTAGVAAGAVILIMCVTGVVLTYERELVAWSDRDVRSTVVGTAPRMPLGTLLERLRASQPDVTPTAITMAAAPDAPVTVAARQGTIYVDAYSGASLGQPTTRVRRFMAEMRAWHRWLAIDGEGRPVARLITGYSNLIFLFIVVSGLFLWVPRMWTWQRVRAVVFFKSRLRGKARDFNWHNTIGLWSAVPLFIVVLCALPISFPWASAAVYRVTGDQPPRPVRGQPGKGGERNEAAAIETVVLDAAWQRAAAQEPAWRTVTFRVPDNGRAPLTFAIDRGDGGEPQLRSTLTIDRRGEVVRYETFSQQRPGARLRAITRFAHTGEILGIAGQTIAGIATAGGCVLVWTGLALALRRLRGATRRGSSEAVPDQETAAA